MDYVTDTISLLAAHGIPEEQITAEDIIALMSEDEVDDEQRSPLHRGTVRLLETDYTSTSRHCRLEAI